MKGATLVAALLFLLTLLAGVTVATPVDLRLVPAGVTIDSVGETFALELLAQSLPPGQDVTAVEAYVEYDDQIFEPVDASGSPADEITPGGVLPNILRNQVIHDGQGGGITYAAGVPLGFPPQPVQTDFTVATMHFKVLQQFSTSEICLVPGPTLRYGGALECKSKVTNWIDDVSGSVSSCVRIAMEALHADADGPYVVAPGDDVLLNALGSTPPGDIERFVWELAGVTVYDGPDGTVLLGWDDLVVYGVSEMGTYPLVLTVYSAGAVDTDETALTVVPEPLTVVFLACGVALLGSRRPGGRAAIKG